MQTMTVEPRDVYHKINRVQSALSEIGISKARKNTAQGYAFRGIDDVYAALSPILAKVGLCILPRVIHREMREQTTAKGTMLFYVSVHVEFDLVSADDGSRHTIATWGEAQDSGDKATNKAMSAAYKYACFMAFCIPTEGDNDADATTHDALWPPVDLSAIESAPDVATLKAAYSAAFRAVGAREDVVAAKDARKSFLESQQ